MSFKGSTVNSMPLVGIQCILTDLQDKRLKKHRIQTDLFVGGLTIALGICRCVLSKLPSNSIYEILDNDPALKNNYGSMDNPKRHTALII
jgi:hypothetical protein